MTIEISQSKDIGSTALRGAVQAAGACVVDGVAAGGIGVSRHGGSGRAAVCRLRRRPGQIERASRDDGSEDRGDEDGELHLDWLVVNLIRTSVI